jgi:tripartite-type tricarboxylate transporter receptor subunit TctC
MDIVDRLKRVCLLLVLVAMPVPASVLPAAADGLDFYKGKTVSLVVGYAPGGGFDAYARLVASPLAAQLKTSVVVENKPGAGGLNALLALLHDPGDALRIMILDGESTLLNQLIDSTGRYDLADLAFLGRASFEARTLVVGKGSPYEHIENFVHSPHPVFFGAGQPTDSLGDPASIFCYALNIACKLVLGYPGAADAALAIQRKEVDALVTSASQAASLVNAGAHTAVTVFGAQRSSLLPQVPTLAELVALPPERYKWIEFRSELADFGRSFVVRGDTPADRVAALTTAFKNVLTDPAVTAVGAETNRPIAYAPPTMLKDTLEKITTAMPDTERAELKHILLQTN